MCDVKKLLIVGTDTGIGKTFISLKLLNIFKISGLEPVYYKPIQTGTPLDTDIIKNSFSGEVYSTYSFSLAATPHLAAEHENKQISLDLIKQDFENIKQKHEYIIVEGAGGVFVPLNEEKKIISDLACLLDLPVLLVSANKLGTINHTCLTIEHLQRKNIKILGFCFSGAFENAEQNLEVQKTNAAFISKYTGIEFFCFT